MCEGRLAGKCLESAFDGEKLGFLGPLLGLGLKGKPPRCDEFLGFFLGDEETGLLFFQSGVDRQTVFNTAIYRQCPPREGGETHGVFVR